MGLQRTRWSANLLPALLALAGCSDTTGPSGPSDQIIAASAGEAHTCALTADRGILCWGSNARGQLGDRTTVNRMSPVGIASDLSFQSVSAGGGHTCALTTDGAVHCWGYNTWGALGTGNDDASTAPVPTAHGIPFTAVTAGGSHTCGLDREGRAFCWGYNEYGQLGAGASTECNHGLPCSDRPMEVVNAPRFKTISAGRLHTCGLAQDDRIYCWGSNEYGELGVEEATVCFYYRGPYPCSPVPIPLPGNKTWREVSAGGSITCGLDKEGQAYCWGYRRHGTMGDGSDPAVGEPSSFEPTRVAGNLTFETLNPSRYRVCGITSDGTAYCWGAPHRGDGGSEDSSLPVQVATETRFSDITAGHDHTCAVGAQKTLFCWGSNEYGQVGVGSDVLDWPMPVAVGIGSQH